MYSLRPQLRVLNTTKTNINGLIAGDGATIYEPTAAQARALINAARTDGPNTFQGQQTVESLRFGSNPGRIYDYFGTSNISMDGNSIDFGRRLTVTASASNVSPITAIGTTGQAEPLNAFSSS